MTEFGTMSKVPHTGSIMDLQKLTNVLLKKSFSFSSSAFLLSCPFLWTPGVFISSPLPPTLNSVEYSPSFNPIAFKDSALSTHKPIEVRGPGGKATIVHAQYNTPISMYSQDAIMDAIAGQSQAKGHERYDPQTCVFWLVWLVQLDY